jgi:predicted DCC family thiol-disulfide oxidoreductase YuxK
MSNAIVGWVLYDDSCGFCRCWIPLWSRSLRSRGFAIAPLQAAWVRQHLGLSENELLRDIRLLLVDGRRVDGASAYRYVMRRIGWALPLYLASNLPLLRQAFDWAYRTFARSRFRFSRACGLANDPENRCLTEERQQISGAG